MLATSGYAGAQPVVTLEGRYTGQNLYVQNPYTPDNIHFCTDSIVINGKKRETDFNASAYVIQLKTMRFEPGDSLNIKIYHQPGCIPKVLNPDRNTHAWVNIRSVKVDKSGLIKWETQNDSTTHPVTFAVEQYVWNKWLRVGEVQQNDIRQTLFQWQAVLHSGENKFRIKFFDYWGNMNLSGPAITGSDVPEVKFEVDPKKQLLLFSGKTRYEIYDAGGNFLERGLNDVVDISRLKKGDYFLNYDCKTGEFTIR